MGSVSGFIKLIRTRKTSKRAHFHNGNLHIILLGTGGPLNNKRRVATSTAIIAGNQFVLIDIGPGSWRNADVGGLPLDRLNAIFLTHFHSDHIGDLGEANIGSWIQGRSEPLEIFGGNGVEDVVQGFNQAYKHDAGYRTAHHGDLAMPPKLAVLRAVPLPQLAKDEPTPVLSRAGLQISAFPVDHSPVEPAVGYRIEYRGKVVVIFGDTKKTPNLSKFAQNADLLISEVLSYDLMANFAESLVQTGENRLAKMATDTLDYHLSPQQAGEVASVARVSQIVLHHLVPPVPKFALRRYFFKPVHQIYKGKMKLGRDGMHIRLKP